jgi:hypothetical protein
MASLIERHANETPVLLSCFDWVVVRGTLPSICHPKAVANELDRLGIRIFHYMQFVRPFRDAVRTHAERLAGKRGGRAGTSGASRPSARKIALERFSSSTASILGWCTSS